ncbi:MAG: hypothetical protein ACJ71Q_09115 [Terriglobales bacterium]
MTISLSITSIQSATKAKAPIVGIPVPDHAPVRLLRSRLKASLKGLTIVSAEYDGTAYDNAGALKIKAKGERVTSSRVYFPVSRQNASKMLDNWAKSQRAKLSKPKPANTTERLLQELKDKLNKMTSRPKNPAVANGYAIPDYQRELFLRWHQQKHIRKQFKSASEFSMAVLTGKTQAELSNPAKHYNWRQAEPQWGAERYAYLLDDERQFVKSQIAAVAVKLYGVVPKRISCFVQTV